MNRSRLLNLAAVLLLVGVLGCSGGSGGPVPVEQLCDAYQDAFCGYLKKCDLEWLYQLFTHRECRQLINCAELDLARTMKSIDAGRLAYDEALAGRCLEAIRNAPCGNIEQAFKAVPSECESVYTGLVTDGGACYFDGECAEGLFCNEDANTCPGQCRAYQGIGDSCDFDQPCLPDQADCDFSSGECRALAGAGESCQQIGCAEGLVCVGDGQDYTCRQPGAAGAACLVHDECEAGLWCSQGRCTAPAGAGESCYLGSELSLALFACARGLYCDADIFKQQTSGTCQAKKGAGQECRLFYECVSGLLCLDVVFDQQTGQVTPGKCGTPRQQGQDCTAGSEFPECDWDLYCDAASATCKPLPGLGEPCVYDGPAECRGEDLYCDSLQSGVAGTCRQKLADGANCSVDEECLSDYCAQGVCGSSEDCEAP